MHRLVSSEWVLILLGPLLGACEACDSGNIRSGIACNQQTIVVIVLMWGTLRMGVAPTCLLEFGSQVRNGGYINFPSHDDYKARIRRDLWTMRSFYQKMLMGSIECDGYIGIMWKIQWQVFEMSDKYFGTRVFTNRWFHAKVEHLMGKAANRVANKYNSDGGF